LTVQFHDGALMYQVKGFSSTEEKTKETTIDPATGFVHAKHGEDNAIMKCAVAIEYGKPDSIHGLSEEDLARLLTVQFHDGALMFQVKGFSSTEVKTMLLVEGGALTLDGIGIVDVAGDHVNLLVEAFGIEGEGRKLSIKTGYGGVLGGGGAGG